MTMQQIDTLATLYAQSLLELAEDAGGQEKMLELADELAAAAAHADLGRRAPIDELDGEIDRRFAQHARARRAATAGRHVA